MEHWSKYGAKYSPFVVTQVLEEQNCFLLEDDFICNNHPQFDYMLYKYLDQKLFDSSFFRLFRIEGKITLVYYWKSKMREPRSHREGIYLIIGILCDYSIFYKDPLCICKAFTCFMELVTNQYQSTDPTEILDMIWKAKAPNRTFERHLSLPAPGKTNNISPLEIDTPS